MLPALSVAAFEKFPVNGAMYAVGEVAEPLGCGYAFRNGATVAVACARAYAEGTSMTEVCGSLSRAPSYDTKKKVLFRRIRPPKKAPKSLWRSGARGSAASLANQSFASSTLFRKYS